MVAQDKQVAADRATRLAAHARECQECSAAPLALDRIAALLDAGTPEADAAAMSARAWLRLRRELVARRKMPWRRVLFGVGRALVPLPVVLAGDAWLLYAAYVLGSAMLPGAVVAYAVLSYAAFLVLVFALTYAAIPLLLVRCGPSCE